MATRHLLRAAAFPARRAGLRRSSHGPTGVVPVRSARHRRPQSRPAPRLARGRLPAGLDGRPALSRPDVLRGVQQGPLDPAHGRAAVVPRQLGPLPERIRRGDASPNTRTSSPNCSTGSVATGPLSSTDVETRAAIDWYWRPDEPGPGHPRGARGGRDPRHQPARGQPPRLRPRRAPLPGRTAGRDPSRADQRRHKLLSRYRANGLLGRSGSGELLDRHRSGRPPNGRITRTCRLRPVMLAQLVEAGDLIPVTVDGLRGRALRRPARIWPILEAAADASEPTTKRGGGVPGPTRSVRLGPRSPARPLRLRLRLGGLRPGDRSVAGATTSCRCSSATTSSVGSNRARTGGPACCASSTSGGRTASSRSRRPASSRRSSRR